MASRKRNPSSKRSTRTAGTTPSDRLVELRDMLVRGATRGDVMKHFGLDSPSSFNKMLASLKKRFKVVVEKDSATVFRGYGDQAVYRVIDAAAVELRLPFSSAITAAVVLRDFASQMLGVHRAGVVGLSSAIVEKFGDELQRDFHALKGRVAFRFLETAQGLPVTLPVFLEAIAKNRTVLLAYEKPEDAAKRKVEGATRADRDKTEPAPSAVKAKARPAEDQPTWEVELHGVFFARRSLYAVVRSVDPRKRPPAYEHFDGLLADHPGLRTLKLSRVRAAKLCETTFTPIPDFDIAKLMSAAWETFLDDKPASRVVIDMDQSYGERVVDTIWHPTQKVTILPTGKYRFEFEIHGFSEIRHWILWLGEGATVISPPGLVEEMKRFTAALASKYQ
jgi:hypothetical protein